MSKCTVFDCPSRKKTITKTRLFTVPKILTSEWLEVLKKGKPLQWMPKKHTKICALHFSNDEVYRNGLQPWATPKMKLDLMNSTTEGKNFFYSIITSL